ncbi:Crp/Fnr family transcriptional regulator [Arachidicoccus ginsenosidimutans]|uniref:Crp/Fnr family transcriptional regulator n=1 Tax=Arachidicoccus sp. BS20 TaxID=1850526 RepID=UPI0007F10CF7|nr:Crp/Fnr family transcriptional regulator [Arachidicoccus sp. BS20]ANI89955.1 Crp/Fnr family transcriptional regulator [Arachidicoccus sp. BS20]
MQSQLISVIKNIIRLSENDEEIILKLFVPKDFRKGEYFLKEGQVSREIGFIEKGLVRYYINKEGEDLIYSFGKENEFVGNYESFLDHSLSNKNIQCIEDTTMLVVSYNNLQVLYDEIAEGQKLGRLVCENLFVEAIRQITSLYTDAPEQRYKKFLDLYLDLQQRIPQYYISSFVGVKPQSLSRIRKRLSEN